MFCIVDYVIMIGMCFLVLPFTYFYAEETLESEDELDLLQDDSDEELNST